MTGAALPRPGSLRAWWLALRPKTLLAALAPVLVGAAVAGRSGTVAPATLLVALFGALLIQAATNVANDLQDQKKGADRADRLGPPRAVALGLLSPRAATLGTSLLLVIALACGIYLTAVAGWPVVVIGLMSIAAGLAYTGGPLPLAYNGLGELFVMIFFGFVAVCGTVYVLAGAVTPLAWYTAVPVGALAVNILVVNNLRDEPTDRRASKRTLAVLFGRRFAIGEYVAMLLLAYLTPLLLWLTHQTAAWVLLPLMTLPLALRLVGRVIREQGAALNRVLVASARLLLQFAALFALGLWR